MERVLAENDSLKRKLVLAMRSTDKLNQGHVLDNAGGILKLLAECAIANAGKKKNGRKYGEKMKEFATLIFVLGGPMLFNIFAYNSVFPSESTVKKHLLSRDSIQEACFRFNELKTFLIERNLPLIVWLSEDGTRVNGRIQYDPTTNQLVGFVLPLDTNGLPITGSFPATSASIIKSHFDTGTVSSNAYIIVAQALAPNAPSFCLALYGTDNRFMATDVIARWNTTLEIAKKIGITVAGMSSDGDSKLLSAMYSKTFEIQNVPAQKWAWFSGPLEAYPVMIQDSIHLLVKLQGKLLTPSAILPFGSKCIASRGHLVELVENISKDKHGLTLHSIEVKDRMNFRNAQKLCSEDVCDLLSNVPGSEATTYYLKMMREVTSAFLDTQLSPLNRIKLMWKWTFFLRSWRNWIVHNKGYTLSHNFITSNAYTCIEVNAHGLLKIIRFLRDREEHDLFLTLLFSSQPCEESFRRFRSQTAVYSTIINFTILEMTHRVRRSEFLDASFHNLQGVIEFPRHRKLYKMSKQNVKKFILPEDYEIEAAVGEAFNEAKILCEKFGMLVNQFPPCALPLVSRNQIHTLPSDDTDDIQIELDTDDPDELSDDCGGDAREDEETDVCEDLIVSTGSIGLKKYENVSLSPKSLFVLVVDGNGSKCIIKKTSLVWLLNSGDASLSSDRLQRVQASSVKLSSRGPLAASVSATNLHVEESLTVGDWCAFVSEDGSVVVGRVLAFSYLTGTTWRKQQYSALTAPVKPPSSVKNPRGIGCLCTWFRIVNNNKLAIINMDVHGYYNIDTYICSLPRPSIVNSQLILKCTETDILKVRNKT